MGIGAPELIVILVILLLLFGAPRLPKLARSLGQASKEFKRGVKDDPEEEARAEPEKPAGKRSDTSP